MGGRHTARNERRPKASPGERPRARTRRRSRRGAQGARGRLARVAGVALRGLIAVVVVWALSLFLFVWNQTEPAPPGVVTDGVAVLTGGPKRLQHAGQVLEDGLAQRLLVSGVNRQATPADIRRELGISEPLFACCVDLGFEAVNTHDNAGEVGAWVRRHHWTSLRIVTAGYHMLRARHEIEMKLPKGVRIVEDGVPAYLPSIAMIREFHKFLGSHLLLLVQVRRGPAADGETEA